MARKPKNFSDQVRWHIEHCGQSRYAIAKATGIDAAVLCHFVAGRRGMSMGSLDKLGKFLGLDIVARTNTRTKGK